MNEEIKEILDYYKKDAEKFEYLMKDYTEEQLKTTFSKNYQRYRNHKLLLDYITNLQQENKKLQERFDNIMEAHKISDELNEEIEQENVALKEELATTQEKWDKDRQYVTCRTKEWLDYKSRCEKAVEFIKEKQETTDIDDVINTDNLLNILQNGSEKDD